MQQLTLTNDLTQYSRSTSLLNLMVSLWFTKAKAKVDKSTNAKRKAKWAKLDPFDMNILIPSTVTGKYYLVDRPAGYLIAHVSIPSLTWPAFFAWLKKTYPSTATPPNSAIEALVDKGTSLDGIEAALSDETTWSGEPTVWKTTDENGDDVILVTGTPTSDENIVEMIKTDVFHGWRFQSAVYTYNTPAEDGKPTYYTAALALSDEAFAKATRDKTVYVVNLGQFKPDDDNAEEPDGGASEGSSSDDTDTGTAPEDTTADT